MSGTGTPTARRARLGLEPALGTALAFLAIPAGLAPAVPVHAQAAQWQAPRGPMLLTREVRRTLADGQELVIRRRHIVRFTPMAAGYLVTGEPAGVEIEAPAELAGMAEVERRRGDDGLFPLRLDAAGLIVARPASAATADPARASAAITAFLARTDLSPAERVAAQTMAARLQAQGQAAGNAWPADLFRPAPGERRETRDLDLPGGRSGRVTVTVAASIAAGGVLGRMQRHVLTEVDGTARTGVESWSLTEAR